MRGFVCLILCALWLATEEKDNQNQRTLYFTSTAKIKQSCRLKCEVRFLPFINTFMSHFREMTIIFVFAVPGMNFARK